MKATEVASTNRSLSPQKSSTDSTTQPAATLPHSTRRPAPPMLLTLNSLQLQKPVDQSGECLVLTELIVPRNGIARRAAVKTIELRKGKRNVARQPLYETALLKERVDGPFGLKVSVTRPLKNPELNQFLRQLLATGIESSVDLFSSSFIRHPLFADLLDTGSERLAERIDSKTAPFIATGGLDLDSESLVSGNIKIPLALTERIRSSDHLKPSEKREKRKSQAKIYRKGTEIGQIVVDLNI